MQRVLPLNLRKSFEEYAVMRGCQQKTRKDGAVLLMLGDEIGFIQTEGTSCTFSNLGPSLQALAEDYLKAVAQALAETKGK